MNKKLVVIVLSIIAIVIYIANKKPIVIKDKEIKIVEVEKVAKGDIVATTDLIGVISSHHQTNLKAKAKGILKIHVKAGSFVYKNDLIAQVKGQNLKQNYQIAQQTESLASKQVERLEKLLKSGHLTKSNFEEKKNNLLEQRRRSSDAKAAANDLNISAPFDGIIGLYKLSDNSQVQENDTINYIYDPNALFIRLELPHNLATKINNDSQIIFKDQQYKINYLQKIIDEQSHMYPAEIDVICEECMLGSSERISLILQEKKNTIVIPFSAVFLRDGKSNVYVVEDSRAVIREVELGIREKDKQEILSGLNIGETLIIRGTMRLYPGIMVEISE